MADQKKSIVLYTDLIHTFEELSNEEAGALVKHLFRYVNDLNPEAPDKLTKVVFEPIKQQLKRDLQKWEGIKERRSEAGRLGGIKSGQSRKPLTEANEANASLVKQTEASEAVSVNVSVINNKDISQVVPTSGIDYTKFIQVFNSYANRNFRVTKGVKTSLKARLKDYSKTEIMQAVEKAHKDRYHIESNFKYLTPEFILRPDKLEKFLNNPEDQKQMYNPAHPQLTN